MIDVDGIVDNLVTVLLGDTSLSALVSGVDASEIDERTRLNGLYIKVSPSPSFPMMKRLSYYVTRYIVEIDIYMIEKRPSRIDTEESLRQVLPYLTNLLYANSKLSGKTTAINRIENIAPVDNDFGAKIYVIPVFYEYTETIV